jgi:hypothetical protein
MVVIKQKKLCGIQTKVQYRNNKTLTRNYYYWISNHVLKKVERSEEEDHPAVCVFLVWVSETDGDEGPLEASPDNEANPRKR